MKKIDWKILNIAFWIEIILTYVLPFRGVDDFHSRAGFPFPFICVYDVKIGVSPLSSMHLNPLGFLFNGMVIYLAMMLAIKAYQKLKRI